MHAHPVLIHRPKISTAASMLTALTTFCISGSGQSNLQTPIWAYGVYISGHLAIRPWATNSVKWGIPEKSYKNVAQQ